MAEHHRELVRQLDLTGAQGTPIAGHDDHRLAAFHEAGHVVMCVVNRMMPTRVTIRRETTAAGALTGRVQYVRYPKRWFTRPWRELDVLLAGAAAEARFHDDHAEAAGAIDRADAIKLARRHARSDAAAAHMVATRSTAVERRFAEPATWDATVQVAATLLAHQTLEGRALLDLCRRTADLVHRPGVAMWKWPGYRTLARASFADGLGPELRAAHRAARRRRAIVIAVVAASVLARVVAVLH